MQYMRVVATLSAALFPAASALGGPVPTTVAVALVDPSSGPGESAMHMVLDRNKVPAGAVRFHVINQSKSLVHEALLFRTNLGGDRLPYDSRQSKFVEKSVKVIASVEDLPPGKDGMMVAQLSPGSYLIACNQAGHLHAGMWARIIVTP